ncbi:MAG: hypothetical protein U0Z44_06750 [Kouleothrix sp.]
MLKFSDSTWRLDMNKGGTLTAEMTLQMAAHARKYDIVPEFSFIVGNPPDARRDVERGIEFIRKVKAINPYVEIIMYRYDPVPLAGEMWQGAQASGFNFPQTLDAWVDPHWERVQLRRSADIPWFSQDDRTLMHDFETVMNAYYPTTTDRRLRSGMWYTVAHAERLALQGASTAGRLVPRGRCKT